MPGLSPGVCENVSQELRPPRITDVSEPLNVQSVQYVFGTFSEPIRAPIWDAPDSSGHSSSNVACSFRFGKPLLIRLIPYFEPIHQAVKLAAVDSQGPRGSSLIAILLLQHRHDMCSFQ